MNKSEVYFNLKRCVIPAERIHVPVQKLFCKSNYQWPKPPSSQSFCDAYQQNCRQIKSLFSPLSLALSWFYCTSMENIIFCLLSDCNKKIWKKNYWNKFNEITHLYLLLFSTISVSMWREQRTECWFPKDIFASSNLLMMKSGMWQRV